MLAHELESRPEKGGISRVAPPSPRTRLQRLPPILRISGPLPAPNCSKAPRGLFVLPREGRIFTATSISPRPPSRQRPDRDTFRAGRNLPDKEFRYLRTVIVTAAVYRGFGSRLAPLPLTFRHWAGVSRHTSPRGSKRRWGAESGPRRLFTKNTGPCEAARRGIGVDTCPVPEG